MKCCLLVLLVATLGPAGFSSSASADLVAPDGCARYYYHGRYYRYRHHHHYYNHRVIVVGRPGYYRYY